MTGVATCLDAKKSFTLMHPLGLGAAAGIPPKAAHVPRAITAAAFLPSSSTWSAMVSSFSPRSPTVPYMPPWAVGTAPSTTKK